MYLIIRDKKATHKEFQYVLFKDVEKFAMNDYCLEIQYFNGTHETRSLLDVEVVNIEAEGWGN